MNQEVAPYSTGVLTATPEVPESHTQEASLMPQLCLRLLPQK